MHLMFIISLYLIVTFIRLELDYNIVTLCDDINNQRFKLYKQFAITGISYILKYIQLDINYFKM